MKKFILTFLFGCPLLIFSQTLPSLGTAAGFGLLSGDSIIAVDTVHVIGNAGASNSVSSYVQATNTYTGGTTVSTALSDFATAKSACSTQSGTAISGTLAGQTLSAGVYVISGNATLNGALTLSGDTSSIYIFNITGNLVIDSAIYYGIGNLDPKKIFWNVGGTTKIDSYQTIYGFVFSSGDITADAMTQGASSLQSLGKITINNYGATQLETYYSGARYYSEDNLYRAGSIKHLGTCINDETNCNIVINPGFEELQYNPGSSSYLCPTSPHFIDYACDWESDYWLAVSPHINNSSLFSDCSDYASGTTDVGVPYNIYTDYGGAGQASHSGGHNYGGMQYADLTTADPSDDIPPFSLLTWTNDERIEKYLPAPLTPGKIYYMEYYTSLADKSNLTGKLAVYPAVSGSIGGYPLPPTYGSTPFFVSPSNITYNTSWTKVSGCVSTTASDIDVIGIKAYLPGGFTSVTSSDPGMYTSSGVLGVHSMAYFFVDDIRLWPLADAGSDYTYSCTGNNYIGQDACSAISGATYSWAGTDAFTIANATIVDNTSPFSQIICTAAGTYTFELTVTYGSCTATDIVVVTNPSTVCTGTTIIPPSGASYTGTSTIGTGTYAVYGDIEITSGTTTINSTDMRFYSGKKITVKSGATLIVDGAWLHSCATCGTMWQGIYLENGGHLQVINGSLIEDATNAIETAFTGSGVPDIVLSKAIFNKNTIHIKFAPNSGNLSANSLKNAVFTCRDLPAPSGSFSTYYNTIKTALSTNTTTSLAPYPTSVTRLGVRTKTGIEFTDDNNSTNVIVGNAAFIVGNRNLTIFDNLDYGVYLTNTNIAVTNCRFQNMYGNQSFCFGCPNYPTGVGIFAPQQTQNANIAVIGGTSTVFSKNNFVDTYKGIEINNYHEVTIESNVFNCTSTPAPTTSPTFAYNAVFLRDIRGIAAISNSSSIKNWSNGIVIVRNSSGSLSYIPDITIESNTISADGSGNCAQAVSITDVSGNSLTSTEQIYVRHNTITDVDNGVYASYLLNNLIAYDNTIVLRYNTGAAYAGFRIEGCDHTEIKNNDVYSLRGTYGSSDNWTLRGIYVTSSTHNRVFCNNLYSLGQCMVYEGTSTSSTNSTYSSTTDGILGNSMSNARTGYMLLNSGIIGQQGNASFPSSNHWGSSAASYADGQTYVSSSSPSSSVLYCLSTTASLPTNNLGSVPYANLISIFSATGSEISCPTSYVPSGLMTNSGLKATMSSSDYALELKTLLDSISTDSASFTASDWLLQQFIYNELSNDSLLLEDSTLDAFYTQQQSTSIGKIRLVSEETQNGNYVQAQSDNASISPENTLAENQKTVNEIYLSHLVDTTLVYSSSDSSALYPIALQCAIEGGTAVYQSRNLISFVEGRPFAFADSCEQATEERTAVGSREKLVNTNKVSLYPNPNQGVMKLVYHLDGGENGFVRLYDLTGKLVRSYELKPGSDEQELDARNVQTGLYLYEVVIDGKLIKKDKVAIVK